jgi:uncharacterized protein YjbJ (UPF0337 family)
LEVSWNESQCWAKAYLSTGVHAQDLIIKERQSMKQSTEDKAKGTFYEVKVKVKENVDRATNNPDLEIEGQVEKIGGKIQKKIG